MQLAAPPRWRLWLFVALVSLAGTIAVGRSLSDVRAATISPAFLALTITTIASGRFRIKVPGHSASVSVSEVFVFASVLVLGPAPATLIVAIDGLFISATQKDRRLYRALFNISEPAISAFLAAHSFFASLTLSALLFDGAPALIAPTIVMAATYFITNSSLTTLAVALEGGQRFTTIWRSHAMYLAMNYYAAASVAVLVFKSDAGVNVGVVGLVAPLLALSYGAYKTAASRVEDTDRHLREVERLYQATVETLAIAVDAKDQVTHGHIRRVQRHTVAVARALGVTDPLELRALEAASLLHDVGKLAVPDYVLNKPGALSHREFECMKQHAEKGAQILTTVEFPYEVVPVVRHHHEQWNGRGYPQGLQGDAIPFGARILSVVDCFDAVTSDRPYRRKMTDEQGIEILRARRGTMYDPGIVDVFIELMPALRAEDRVIDGAEQAARSTAPVVEESSQPVATASVVADEADAAVLVGRLRAWLPGAEACLFTPAESHLIVTSSTPRLAAAMGVQIPIGEGLAGWLAVNRHTIINSHADLDLGSLAARLQLEACTATPVFALGELVGILSVYLPHARKFTQSDVRAVGAIAQELGLRHAQSEFFIQTPVIAVAAA